MRKAGNPGILARSHQLPLPVRLIFCGLPAALSATEMTAVRVPSAVGLNVTVTKQLAPAASDVPQLLITAKSAGFVPPSVTATVKTDPPVFDSNTLCGGLDVPTAWLPKLRLLDESATRAGA